MHRKTRWVPACVNTAPSLHSGAGPNGAIIHYRAEAATAGTVEGNTLLLVDSGEAPLTQASTPRR